ncbi:MAG: lactonase family protein [Myxococcales bacterium]|nr:lactonase family protein [Myxococcales bacterium]
MRRRALTFVLASATCGDEASDSGDSGGASSSSGASSTISTTSTPDPDTSASTSSSATAASSTGDPDTTADSSGTTGPELPTALALFVSSGTTVMRFAVDLDTGAATAVETLELGADVGPMVQDEAGTRLWVARYGDRRVLGYAIAPDGTPSPIAETDVGLAIVYLSRSEAGPHLLAADFNGGEIASFGLQPDGAVIPGAISSLDVAMQPHAIVLAPDRRFAFVPHLGGDQIRQFTFDATSGVLAPNDPLQVDAAPGNGPRHMIFSADVPVAWVSNENGDSVTTWAYDAEAGRLGAPQTISTLPAGVDGGDNYVADLHVTPDGRFVYVSNRGHDTLAIFAVQPDGSLVAAGHAPTEAYVRDFAIEPGGRFLFAAGQNSGTLATHRIGADGQLQHLGAVAAGPSPVWVEIIAIAPQ